MNELVNELKSRIDSLERIFNSVEEQQAETKAGILNRIDAYCEVLMLIDKLTPQ